MSGIEATRQIIAAHPEVVVFLCSTYDAADLPRDATDSGARAYVNKEQFGAASSAAAVGRARQLNGPGVPPGVRSVRAETVPVKAAGSSR